MLFAPFLSTRQTSPGAPKMLVLLLSIFSCFIESRIWPGLRYLPLYCLYNGATSVLKLHSEKVTLERGARESDNISPKPFTACLQDAIIKRIDLEGRGINMDGEYLSHLIFADDIILFAKSPKELTTLLTDIHSTSKPGRPQFASWQHQGDVQWTYQKVQNYYWWRNHRGGL